MSEQSGFGDDVSNRIADDGTMVTITGSAPKPKTTKMTDSGITHTIPNNSVVTVTRHTVITAGLPPQIPSGSTAASSSTFLESSVTSSVSLPSQSQASSETTPNLETQTILSIKGIAGIAVGGVVLVIFLLVCSLLLFRHRRGKKRSISDRGDDDANGDEKHFPAHVSAHTTGTQADRDPFAEFGGREDDPHRLHEGVFEMDAASTAPIELPAMDTRPTIAQAKEQESTFSASHQPREAPLRQAKPTDPRANLTLLRTESGQPTYVNQWNQWKSPGETRIESKE